MATPEDMAIIESKAKARGLDVPSYLALPEVKAYLGKIGFDFSGVASQGAMLPGGGKPAMPHEKAGQNETLTDYYKRTVPEAGLGQKIAYNTPRFSQERAAYLKKLAGPDGRYFKSPNGDIIVERGGGKSPIRLPASAGWSGVIPDIAEGAASTAGAIVGGVLGAPVGFPLVGAAIGSTAGAMLGDIGRQVAGNAIAGDDKNADVPLADRAMSTATTGAATLASEAIMGGLGAAGGAVKRSISPQSALEHATSATKRGLGAASAVNPAKTVGKYFDESKAIKDAINADPASGGAFRPSMAQMTGSREGMMAERTIGQMPGMLDEMSARYKAQNNLLAKVADASIDRIAADPKALGQQSVGDDAGQKLVRLIDNVRKQRSTNGRQLFGAVEQMAGDKRIFPAQETIAALDDLIKSQGIDKQAASGLMAWRNSLGKKATETGRISFDDWASLHSLVSELKNGQRKVSENLVPSKQQYFGAVLSDALEADAERAGKAIGTSQAAAAFQAARKKWAEDSAALEDVAPSAIKRIIDAVTDGKPEAVFDKFKSMSGTEAGNFLRILDKADPATGNNFRAQAVSDMFEGAVGRDLVGGAQRRATSANAAPKILEAIDNKKRNDLLKAMFGDGEHAKAIGNLFNAADMISITPGVAGSDTMPKLVRMIDYITSPIKSFGAKGTEIADNALRKKEKFLNMIFETPELAIAASKAATSKTAAARTAAARGLMDAITKTGAVNLLFEQSPEAPQIDWRPRDSAGQLQLEQGAAQ